MQEEEDLEGKETEGAESNDQDDDDLENNDTDGADDQLDNDMTPGEESDDEAEEDYSSPRDEGGSETGGNEEEVVIISFPSSRKRAYSVCLYVSPPTATASIETLLKKDIKIQKSRIPKLINPTGIRTVYTNVLYSHLAHPVIVRPHPSQTLNSQTMQPSRIPRPIAPSFYLRHATS